MDSSHPPLLTRKAKATRAALFDAARKVIARDGYANTRISDIAQEAGKSNGLFYTYFEDKNELFKALIDEFHGGLKEASPAPNAFEEHTAAAVEAAIRVFWSNYRTYHPELAGLMEASQSDPYLLNVWRQIRQRGIRRFAFRIRKQQELGHCEGLDPELGASALYGMMEFACFNWHSRKLDFPDKSVDEEQAIKALYYLIAHSLGLDHLSNAQSAGQTSGTKPSKPSKKP